MALLQISEPGQAPDPHQRRIAVGIDLGTTHSLVAAVRNGVGREAAHEAIKEAAVGTALAMRAGQVDNDVFAKLAADERLGLTRE